MMSMSVNKIRHAVLTGFLLAVSGIAFSPTINIAHAQDTTLKVPYTRADIVLATNKAREAKRLDSLTTNAALSRAAQKKANDMVTQGYFGHISPTGIKYLDFVTNAGYSYRKLGENLAFRYETPRSIINAWLRSEGHRANVLGSGYTDVGVGMAYGTRNGYSGWYIVELFGTKARKPVLTQL